MKLVLLASPYSYPAPAAGPTAVAGTVATRSTAGGVTAANGVAVIGTTSYTADGNKLVKVTSAGAVSLLAGNAVATNSCQTYTAGIDARFVTSSARLRVVGTDGRYLYATDDCGIRRIDPNSGAVTTLTLAGNFASPTASVAIAGQYLYAVDNTYGGLTKIDLASGKSTLLNRSLTGAVAADAASVWVVSGTTLLKVDPSTGNATAVSSQLPTAGFTPTAIVSAGGYLYASVRGSTSAAYSGLIKVTKTTGSASSAATGLIGVTGIATDDTRLFVADTGVKTVS